MRVSSLPTPQVLVDRTRLIDNLDRIQAAASEGGLRLRPHAKTHKSPTIARWQMERGAVGICCAKTGEAEIFVGSGIQDVRLAYPVQPFNSERLLSLMHRAHISILVDHYEVAREWSAAMTRAGHVLDVLVKVDVGFHRCGIDPEGASAVAFLRKVADLPGLRLQGVLSHAGHGYAARSEEELRQIASSEAETLNRLAKAASAEGLAVDERSVGATPTFRFSVQQPGLTEVRPGNYAYLDRSQVELGAANLQQCALTVMATVVSRPSPDRIVLDCGSKTLSSDQARGFNHPRGYGAVFPDLEAERPDERLLIERLSEEHAVVKVTDGTVKLEPGARVRVLPNHACVVSNLVNEVVLIEGLEVVECLPVQARGRIS